ncbi:lysylphosphatidylglycerol synthase transmembrane domain-containing protein [Patescibacteria group bacterium]
MFSLKKLFYYLLFLLGTALLVATVFKLGPRQIGESFLRANFWLVGLGILVYLLAVTFRSLRWFLLFRRLNHKISYFRFLPTYFVSLMVGNFTPFKSGEVIAPYLFKRNLKSKIGNSFTLIFFDRFFDILILIFCMVLGFVLIGTKVDFPENVRNLFWVAIALLGLISVGIIFVFSFSRQSGTFFKKLASRFRRRAFLSKIFEWFSKEVVNFHKGVTLLRNSPVGYLVALLAVFSWAAEFFAFYLFVSSVLDAPFWLILSFQILSIGIGIISFIPAGMGIGTVSFVFFISLTSYSVVDAGAGGIMAKVISLVIIYFVGVLGLVLTRSIYQKRKFDAKT